MPDYSKAVAEKAPPFIVLNESMEGPFVLTCEHASNYIPDGYGQLGVPSSKLSSHIAIDVGVADVAVRLSVLLSSPLIRGTFSRLLIDLNRPVDRPSSIPQISDECAIPGNHEISLAERSQRKKLFFSPYHGAVSSIIDRAQERGCNPVVVSIHSFEPVIGGVRRPWDIGILYRRSTRLAQYLIQWLRSNSDCVVGDNEPYEIDEDDYTIPVHGESRNLDAVLIEIRNDLIQTHEEQNQWAKLLFEALSSASQSGVIHSTAFNKGAP